MLYKVYDLNLARENVLNSRDTDVSIVLHDCNIKYFAVSIQRQIQSILFNRTFGKYFFFHIQSKGLNVGLIFLSSANLYRLPDSFDRTYEITIEIFESYRNSRYATNAICRLLELIDLHVVALVRADNNKSNRLFSKLAFSEKILTKIRAPLGSRYNTVNENQRNNPVL